MNVIVANKYQTLLGSSEIDVIKTSYGIFDVNDIIVTYKNFFYNKLIIDVTAINNYENVEVIQNLSLNLDVSKIILLLDDSEIVNSALYLSKLVSFGIYNFTKKVDTAKFLIDNPNSYKDVAGYQNVPAKSNVISFNDKLKTNVSVSDIKRRILGIQNVTEHAGSTTLSYLMKKYLEEYYTVKCIELDKTDYSFFNEKNMISSDGLNINNVLAENFDDEIIIIDLNSNSAEYCTDIIYLIEPGIIKLNKLIKNQPKIFDTLKEQKVILNKSPLTQKDVSDFERESGSRIFTNVPYIDDKIDNDTNIISLLIDLGFTRVNEETSSGLMGLF